MSRISQRNRFGFGLLRFDFRPGRLIMEEDVNVAIVTRTLNLGFCALETPSGSFIALDCY